jgi:hypothetical protein
MSSYVDFHNKRVIVANDEKLSFESFFYYTGVLLKDIKKFNANKYVIKTKYGINPLSLCCLISSDKQVLSFYSDGDIIVDNNRLYEPLPEDKGWVKECEPYNIEPPTIQDIYRDIIEILDEITEISEELGLYELGEFRDDYEDV